MPSYHTRQGFALGFDQHIDNKEDHYQMKPEYMTAALCGYFQGSPSGRFSPARIREEMGITSGEWRHFAIRHLYPVDAIARKKLAEFGVSIVTESEPKQLGHNELMVTNFIKVPCNHRCHKQAKNA